jgi:hypothetical protein
MPTQTRKKNPSRNGQDKTPELGDILGKKRGPGRPKKTRTATQIADSIEAEAKRLKGIADILRGKA